MLMMTIPNFCRTCGKGIPDTIGIHFCSVACEDRCDFDWSDSRIGHDWEDEPFEDHDYDDLE